MHGVIAGLKIRGILAAVLLLLAGISTALADQVTLSWIDADSQAQSLTVDANSSAADLALAASLMGEYGVGIAHDPDNGTGTLAEIGAALAAAAPIFAPDIALALVRLSPQDEDAIVAAVNAVAGINTTAVLAAVHFGSPDRIRVPPVAQDSGLSPDLPIIEQVPSRN